MRVLILFPALLIDKYFRGSCVQVLNLNYLSENLSG